VARAGQRERFRQEFERMAQVDDAHQVSRVELALQVLGLKARCGQLFQHYAAAIETDEEECDDAENEQCAGEAAYPVEHAWVALEQIAKEAPRGQQRSRPKSCSDAIEEKKSAKRHAVLAGDGRR